MIRKMDRLPSDLVKAMKGSELTPIIIEFSPKQSRNIIVRLRDSALGITMLNRFNMLTALVSSEIVESLLDIQGVKAIYLDRLVRIPEIPPLPHMFNMVGSSILGLTSFFSSRKRPSNTFNSTFQTFQAMGAADAFKAGITGLGVRVGIVDSDEGFRVNFHPQLRGRVESHSISPSTKGANLGHGSHVGTTIHGARVQVRIMSNRQTWVEGGAPQAIGIYVKSLISPLGIGTVSQILKGISIALDRGAHIINLSLGSEPTEKLEDDPFHIAFSKVADKALFVSASGNDGENQVSSPANSPYTIAVSAMDPETNETASFSNYGDEIDWTAPGVKILSGLAVESILDITGRGPIAGYSILTGTSMATPHISSMLALMTQLFQQKKGVRVTTEMVRDMGVRLGESKSQKRGYGLLTWDLIRQYAELT